MADRSITAENRTSNNCMDSIIDTVGTFRIDAKIVIEDVRFAATVDGHDLSGISGSEMARIMRARCDPIRENDNHFSYWVRRW